MNVKPFPGFLPLAGYHCITCSFRKILEYNRYPVSEEMILGLGEGPGFAYLQEEGQLPFFSGRVNMADFHSVLAERTGVTIIRINPDSAHDAQNSLIDLMQKKKPVMLFADMGLLPYLKMPEGYHFGGHTIVAAGYDTVKNLVLISDIDQPQPYLKDGRLYEITLHDLAAARDSRFHPFPPENVFFTFDFTERKKIGPEEIFTSIKRTAAAMLEPVQDTFGISGIRKSAAEISHWGKSVSPDMLGKALVNAYIFIETGGTGGGMFRDMYSRFLYESAVITGNKNLADAAGKMKQCANEWSRTALTLKDLKKESDPLTALEAFSTGLKEIAGLEEQAFTFLHSAAYPV